jgi:hypothetical protein
VRELVSDHPWVRVAAYSDRISAEAILGLLTEESLPCYIGSNEYVPGLGSHFAVFVPADLMHRARWILEQARVSEEELTFLATGTLSNRTNDE